jgi:LuxR family maltose regulon positive regulatory protein
MIMVDAYNVMIHILIARGDLDAADKLLEKSEKSIQAYPILPETREMLEANRVRFWLAKNDFKSALAWSRDRQHFEPEVHCFERELGEIALARILIAQDALTEAGKLLSKLSKSAESGGRFGRLVEILLLRARVLQLQNKWQQALSSLEKSLQFAKLGNYIRTYVDEGKWVEELLRLEAERNDFSESGFSAYVHQLADAFTEKPKETDKASYEV